MKLTIDNCQLSICKGRGITVLKAEKQNIVEHLHEKFQDSASAICVDFRGVNVDKITQFRRQIQEASANYQVVKNTLARRAIAETSFQDLGQFLVGPTGIVFCKGDPMEPAKVVTSFIKDTNGALQIKGGVVDGNAFDAKGIEQISKLPSRQEMLAQLVSSLQSPISGLVGTLEGITREFVYTLQALADQRAEG
jgi:large subunit ribosomal protein L10